MKKRWNIGIWLLFLGTLFSLPAAAAETSGPVGQSTAIISSLTLPDYTKPTVCESELGRLVADALRTGTGSEAAMVAGGELRGGLPKGALTEEDLRAVLPEASEVLLLEVSGEDLWETLEYGLSFSVLDDAESLDREASEFFGFPQLSGLEVEYDVSQLPGQRIRWIRRSSGEDISPDSKEILTLAVSEYFLQTPGYDRLQTLPREESARSTADYLVEYVQREIHIAPATVNRIRAVGTAENGLIQELGILPFFPLLIILILLVTIPGNKKKLRNLDGSHSKRYRDYGNGK